MIEYTVVSIHDRKKMFPSTKPMCDGCHGKIDADWTLVSHTQLGPKMYCTTCGVSQLAGDMEQLASMTRRLANLLPLAPREPKK